MRKRGEKEEEENKCSSLALSPPRKLELALPLSLFSTYLTTSYFFTFCGWDFCCLNCNNVAGG